MFEDGARIDDILNILRKPTLDNDKKKTEHISDAGIRYDIQRPVGEDNIKFEFTKNSEGLI